MKFTKKQKLAMAREHIDDHIPLYQLYEKYVMRISQSLQSFYAVISYGLQFSLLLYLT